MDTFAEADKKAHGFQRAELHRKAKKHFFSVSSEEIEKDDWKQVRQLMVDHELCIMPGSLSSDKLKSASYRSELDALFQWCDHRQFTP